jgi:stage II sporulation protein M
MASQQGQSKVTKNLLPYVLGATIIFVIALVQGFSVSPSATRGLVDELKKALEPIVTMGPIALVFIIFLNNAIKAFFAIVLGILIGLPPLFFIGMNGFAIGMVISALGPSTGWNLVAASLAPHGILEIPLMLLAAAWGLAIGVESLKFLGRQRSQVKLNLRQGLSVYLKWILTGLLIAAVIEVFITPQIVFMAGGTGLSR